MEKNLRTIIVVFAATFACVISLLSTAADVADPVDAASIAALTPGPPTAGESDEVKKPVTRSDRVADGAQTSPPKQPAADVPEPAEVVKTKTKSNQSNDRVGDPANIPATGQPGPEDEEPAEVLKTKTKSNQSND